MRIPGLVLAPLLLLAAPALGGARGGESLVVVEYYTSQGCAGCLETSEFAQELAAQEGVLLLSFGVDYWDYLGWRDTYAQPEFADRQRGYIGRLTNPNLHPYTPQMVVDGHLNSDGFSRDFVKLAIDICIKEGHVADGPRVELRRDGGDLAVDIGAGARELGDVWLVGFEPGERDVAIGDGGENARKVMKTYNVVREVTRLGDWTGDAASFKAPLTEGLAYAVLVQRAELGPMIATAAEPTPAG